MIAQVIDEAHRAGKPIGICGQAPSDFPEFARWLVEQGITSISLNPDVAIKTHLVIADEESLLYGVEPAKSESPTVVVPKLTNQSLASQQSSVGRCAPPQSNCYGT
jgi:phosphoenolpyruvate-protein kinase (PTS system EI component)